MQRFCNSCLVDPLDDEMVEVDELSYQYTSSERVSPAPPSPDFPSRSLAPPRVFIVPCSFCLLSHQNPFVQFICPSHPQMAR